MTDTLNPVEKTALLTAALRAAETARDDRLYDDPYAARLVGETGPELLAEVRRATFPADRPGDLPSTPDYNAIRTRFFDDYLQRAAAEPGMTQIVLAPAGMDSRAHRLAWPGHIRYFEVDRPAVLEFKAGRLRGAVPQVTHTTVAVDLTADDWEDQLLAAGYDPALPSTWLLEGLLYYIPERDTRRLLQRVAALMAPGSRIAADLVNTAALTLPDMRGLLDVFDGWGCPWVFGSDEPEALFDGYGFDTCAVQPGEPGADFGRWPDPVPERQVKDVSRVFLVHGQRR
ncbi:SAM-dependent methyltransferase [Streptomyces sp. NBC_01267]|uniref:class I SAM-dependent methyltransferase n=1 Tax=unclassified Streptomyces TaxID=2593676 RepID=UPI00202513FE|nr:MULTISPECIES: SAM-dependent methyltransferase [unclassified Streptomyces]MCX4553302.1 SAM-dependent methyltransferase [Streptomyces sp. NBC_01500]WSV52309.1 SAM-dependent methyltransferase [Streptomyces sp. NBC_01014]